MSFTVPKHFEKSPHFNYSKFPRKLKKSLKKTPYFNGDYNRAMWVSMDKEYKRFLINQICKKYEKF